ncbi:MAG: DMT family transporter [Flavobacteriaceae bacterium]|nr:DMT family transporter [Flavobacteriaceae bacterium]
MDKRILALLAAFGATTIYGLNHTIAKVIMPDYIGAFGLVMLRVVGATILFWSVSLFYPSEKIDRPDFFRIGIATLFGMCINMLMFIKGLSLSTPINSSVIVTLTPIMVMILSAIFLKEKITIKRGTGIFIGFGGAALLILQGNNEMLNAPNIPLGNIMMFANAMCYGTYLVLIKPLTKKYSTITLMKWMFIGGVFLNLPITFTEITEVSWTTLPFEAIWRMAFVVVGTTFCTYLFNVYALRTLSPTTVGAFVYLQPLMGILFATYTGNDQLDLIKCAATVLVFIGVYLVTKKPKTA